MFLAIYYCVCGKTDTRKVLGINAFFVWKYVYRCLYLLISRFEESTDYYQTSLRYKSCFLFVLKGKAERNATFGFILGVVSDFLSWCP